MSLFSRVAKLESTIAASAGNPDGIELSPNDAALLMIERFSLERSDAPDAPAKIARIDELFRNRKLPRRPRRLSPAEAAEALIAAAEADGVLGDGDGKHRQNARLEELIGSDYAPGVMASVDAAVRADEDEALEDGGTSGTAYTTGGQA